MGKNSGSAAKLWNAAKKNILYFSLILISGLALAYSGYLINSSMDSFMAGGASGSIFRDYNGDGIKQPGEPLVGGVTVNAYNTSGVLCATTVSTAAATSPNYTLPMTCAGQIRIEFIIGTIANCLNDTIDFSSTSGGAYGSSVQFANAAAMSTVNFALNNPADYSKPSANTNVYIPCYTNGDPTGGGNSGTGTWFVGFPYNNAGTTPAPAQIVNGVNIGATWGVAYSKQAKILFTSAFVRRHIGLGTMGPGGIYALTPTAGSFTASNFYNMDANGHRTSAGVGAPPYGSGISRSFNLVGSPATSVTYNGIIDPLTGLPSGFGVVGSNIQRGLPAARNLPSNDTAVFDQVGKVGLGDLEISDDGKYLFVMNVYSRYLFRLTLNDPYAPGLVTAVDSFQVPNPGCVNGNFRPWAVKFYRNKVYIGGVCSGENNGVNVVNGASDIAGYVYELNNPIGAAVFNPVPIINVPLNYAKGASMSWTGPYGLQWYPWTNSTATSVGSGDNRTRPTPMLSNLEFSDRGDLILSFMDRASNQWGWVNYRNLTGTVMMSNVSGGDLLIAGLDCSSGNYLLESGGSYMSNGVNRSAAVLLAQGPGTGEFFYDERIACCHQETHTGAIAILRGDSKLITAAMDPIAIQEGGTIKFSLTNGTKSDGYRLFLSGNSLAAGTFGKANGLGDIEVSGFEAPLELGNRVWNDLDGDGVQDANEPPIANITIEIYADFNNDGIPDGVSLGSDVTDVNGNYYFDTTNILDGDPSVMGNQKGPQPNKRYLIRIGSSDWSGGIGAAELTGFNLTNTNTGEGANPDLNDNDANLPVSNIPTISYLTGALGQNNHTLDFGFEFNPPAPPVVDLALKKTIDAIINNSNPNTGLNNGDTVKFKIQLTNQGVVSMDSLHVTDYLPAGFNFVNATGCGQPNEGWDATDPQNPFYEWTGKISPVQALPLTAVSGDDVTSLTILNHDPGCSTNRLLLVGIAVGNTGNTGTPETVTSVTFGGIPLIQVGDSVSGGSGTGGNNARVYIYQLVNPTGVEDIIISLSGAADIVAQAITFAGVDQINPLGPFQAAAEDGDPDPAINFVSASGEVLFTVLSQDEGGAVTIPGGSGQTEVFNGSEGVITGVGVIEPGASIVTSSFTIPDQDWAMGAVSIRPATFRPGDTLDICIYTTLQHVPGSPTAADFTNFSEISYARDTTGVDRSDDDIDSPLNNDPDDNAGGQPESPADDYVNGNGSGTPGDGIAATDQDNHDPALLHIFDLALKKTIDSGSISTTGYVSGDTIQFNITVTNQGTDTAQNIEITDTLPCGLSFLPDQLVGWSLSPPHTYTITPFLAPGQSVSVPILVKIEPSTSCNPNPFYTVNYAQISAAEDADGNPLTGDVDGTYDQNFADDAGGRVNTNSDDVIIGDGTGVPLDEVAATDADDQDPAQLLVFDLALRKVVSPLTVGYPGPYQVGDTIRFDITIFNQGNLPAVEILVVDTVPAGLSFDPTLNTTWNAGPESNEYNRQLTFIGDSLKGDEDTTISIFLTVVHTSGGIPAYTNISEIASAVTVVNLMRDTFAQDADSPYDSNFKNDAGGAVGSPADDEIDGFGTGNPPGGSIASEDEDAQDPALVPIVDLALTKVISDTLQDGTNFFALNYGDTVKFDITVINQGTVHLDSVEVTDYIPAGFTFGANPNWTLDGSNAVTVIHTRLDPMEDTVICLYLVVSPVFDNSKLDSAWINYAEISHAYDTLGVLVDSLDFDSLLDSLDDNNAGGQPGSLADNYVGGDGTGVLGGGVDSTDQDNHDPAFVNVFDVALRKVIGDTLGDGVLAYGDTVRFDIQLFNQANTIVDSLVITDYIPSGFTFLPGLNPGWSGSPPTPIYEWGAAEDLLPGDSATISIYLQLIAVGEPALEDYTNYAEISFASDISGADRSNQDADSPLNGTETDNPGGQPLSPADNYINGDGSGLIGDGVDSTDQDNHDPAALFPRIIDLALRKVNQFIGPVSYGDTVALLISVINQGTITMDSVEVTDYLPVGFEFPQVLNPDWTVVTPNLLTSVIRTPLPGGASAFLPLYLIVRPVTDLTKVDSAWTNFAEVSNGWEDALPVGAEDMDSPWDQDPDNNEGGEPNTPADDFVDGDGTGPLSNVDSTDQDNHDPVLVAVADLALRKIIQDTLGDAILSYGDTIKFGIQIFNQSNTPVDSIVITDSIPAGFTFVPGALNTGWTLIGQDANYIWGAGDTLFTGESDTICIYLTLNMVDPSSSTHWINRAEIAFFSDTLGMPLLDADSNPDEDQTNDPGGNPNTPSDDPIDGDGTGMPGDTSSTMDEDDEDPAGLNFFDLALVKIVDPGSTVTFYGDSVKFLITVTNQGTEPVDSMTITDSLPAGLQFDNTLLPVNNIWTQTGNELNTTIVGRLNPGEDTTICLALRILKNYDLSLAATTWVNLAEISAGYDTTGVPIVDIDSPLNDNYGDNAGGQPESPADDETDGNGTGAIGDGVDSTDQDNADPALVQVADLALRKVPMDTLGDNLLIFGDTVKIGIQVFNQGSVPVDSFIVTDSLPAGLGFVAGPLNAGWTYSSPEAVYNWGLNDTLFPGESDTLCLYVVFQLALPGTPATYTNLAEITEFFDTNGDTLSDVDSWPDNDQTNDAGGEPKTGSDDPIDGDGTGMPGDTSSITDEDDHDVLELGYFDIALSKIINSGSSATYYGDTVKFDITIINQGSIPTDSIVIRDSIPVGFSFDPLIPGNADWTLLGNIATRSVSGFLLTGLQDTTICIWLTVQPVLDPAARADAWINYAEISEAWLGGTDISILDIDSELNDIYGDNRGGQPKSPADDYVKGDGTGAIGDGVDTTDQDNADPAFVDIVDLALRKVIVDTLGDATLNYGDTIKFMIQLFNQGNIPMDSLSINDTIPNGFSYVNDVILNAGWSGTYPEVNYAWTGVTLFPGDSVSICIYLRLEQVTMGIPDFTNRAEISFARDTAGFPRSADDIDSPLNDNYGDNIGGQPETPADDFILGDGKSGGMIGDGVAITDQDNADPARIEVVDLALRKTLVPGSGSTVLYGDTAEFIITVINQGNVPLTNIKLTDSLPDGFVNDPAVNPGWMIVNSSTNFSTFCYTIPDTLFRGDTIDVLFYGIVEPSIIPGAWINYAEITSMQDTVGNGFDRSGDDIDSNPDNSIGSNDAGGLPESDADDEVNGDGTGMVGDGVADTDEDDQDPAALMLFDLALKKLIDPSTPGPYQYGDTVKFAITVFNQASVPSTNIVVSDSVPAGFIFDPTINPGWSGSYPVVRDTITDTIFFRDSVVTCISLIIQPVAGPAEKKNAWTNLAEISYAEDTLGNGVGVNLPEHDSWPDENFSNDAGGQVESPADNYIDGNGMGAIGDGVALTDEDDADRALVEIFDLALTKQIDTLGTTFPYTYGDSIKFKIKVINQGNEPSINTVVTDYIPVGFAFDAASNPDWVYMNDSTVNYTISDTLFHDQDTTICIYLRLVMASGRTSWTNVAEISFAADTLGHDKSLEDADHVLDDDRTNNAGSQVLSLNDDYVDGDGTGAVGDPVDITDGDNIDPAWIDIFDLALIKTTPKVIVVEGEIVDFYITVYNQGNIDADNIKIIDYIPSDMTYNAGGWTTVADSACLTLTGTLGVGDSITVQIDLQVNAQVNSLPEGLYNFAEINSATDTLAQNYPDIDGDFDSDPNNDPGGDLFNDDDNNISGNGKRGEDEDNHDGAWVGVCSDYVCQDLVTISLDADCSVMVTGDDVIQNPKLPSILYRVTIRDASGRVVPNATFTRAHIGYCFTYTVDAPLCDPNGCWGTICVEDKFPPAIDCAPDTVLCSELANIPVNIIVNDNCSGPAKVSIASEQFIDYGCDSVNIQGIVIRRLLATDLWGNTRDCEKYYYIRRVHIADVICPRDTSIDCSLANSGGPFSNPARSGAPSVSGISLWPNTAACKLTVNYTDERLEICGGGYKIIRTWIISDWCLQTDTLCMQTIKVEDRTAPNAPNITLPTVKADAHDCRAPIQLDTLPYSDCGRVTQEYSYPYIDPATGATKYATGSLPAKVFIYSGTTIITVTLTDGCLNRTLRTITVSVQDETGPTPVCHEYTQVTVDPVSCWSTVEAKSLDNGSHDNCCGELHYAAAHMDSVTYWRNYWNTKLELEVGKAAYKADKIKYDALIEDWINCYVFADVLHFDNCGTNQVILRVYEACGLPRYDEHVWPCTPHQWFCYNTYLYMADFNYNWFDPAGPKSCDYRPELTSLVKLAAKYELYETKGYLLPRFDGAARFEYCSVPFYFPEIENNSDREEGRQPGDYCSARLYNDCMIQVLVDDKQAPVVENLRDITVYCDQAPAGTNYARLLCKSGDYYNIWPGTISSGGKVHGYYGGSDHITNHAVDVSEHSGPQAPGCGEGDSWSPIYCRDWLILDIYDQAGQIDPKQYFSTLVKFDKYRPARTLTNNEFSITDNCRLDDASMTMTDVGSLNSCGEGWFQRIWSIKDKCGNEVKAVQKVIVKHRSDFEVVFPQDLEVNCETINATDSSRTGKPVITDDECENIGLRYVDEISTIDGGACYKIIRTWTLIDWCIFDANIHTFHPDVIVDDRVRADTGERACVFRNLKDNGDGYMKYVQIIKVRDHSAPVITCRDSTFCIQDGCSVNINIPIQAVDNCAGNVLLRLEITRPDGSIEKRTDVNAITGTFSSGLYQIKIIGKDRCNNEDTCMTNLVFNDCKKPTPYCLNGVATVVMPSTGTIEIWAKDLDRGSTDNCTPNSELRFSFSSNTSNASRVFGCSDILNGKQHAIEVQIWVTDNSGNQDWCKTYILLQDNGGQPGGVCKDTTLAVTNINGRLYTEDKEGVEFATVEVKGLTTSPGIPAFKTASDGGFAFNSVQMAGDYSLKALRDDNPMNGVSTLDMILIQKHILGTEKLKSPYKMIAADANNSDDISVQDLIELRKLILGIYEKLPANTSWKFIPKTHQFNDVQNPWGYPTEEKLTGITDNNFPLVRDFVGVKIGDVNSSAVPHSLMGVEVRGNDKGLLFEVTDRVFKRGELVDITFRSPNFRGISGWQGTMNFGSKLEFIGLKEGEGQLQMTEHHIGKRWADQGFVTMSWNNTIQGGTGIDIDETQDLFTMVFRAHSTTRLSEVLRIGSQYTRAESYEGKGELANLSLRFMEKDGKEVSGKSELYQNYPNPFDQRTVIGINLAQEGRGTLRITDITGRAIKVIEQNWTKGYHEVWLDRRELQASGVLYYSFESDPNGSRTGVAPFRAVKKMVIME